MNYAIKMDHIQDAPNRNTFCIYLSRSRLQGFAQDSTNPTDAIFPRRYEKKALAVEKFLLFLSTNL